MQSEDEAGVEQARRESSHPAAHRDRARQVCGTRKARTMRRLRNAGTSRDLAARPLHAKPSHIGLQRNTDRFAEHVHESDDDNPAISAIRQSWPVPISSRTTPLAGFIGASTQCIYCELSPHPGGIHIPRSNTPQKWQPLGISAHSIA